MIPIMRPWLPPLDEYVDLLQEIWDSRMLSNFATFSQRLEDVAKASLGSSHVLATSSGDVALIVTLKALEVPRGAPCFVSDFTFNSTVNAALWNGLRPVLVDIDPDTLNMSSSSLRTAMDVHQTPGVVLATHVFGNPCDTESLGVAAADHGSYLVFDAAHAYGSLHDGRPVGSFGDAEVFSLSGTKLVTSAEGGLISTPHDWLAERVVYLRAYGFQHDYRSKYVGINGKLSELHAALGVLTLPHIEAIVERHGELVNAYRRRLGDLVGWQVIGPHDRSTYKDLVIRLGGRRMVVETALEHAGVQVKRYFVPLHKMQPYSRFAFGSLAITEEVYETSLCIPIFVDIEDTAVDRICDTIAGAVEDRGAG